MKFEDLTLEHLYFVKDSINKTTPDDYDEMWLNLLIATRSALRISEGDSYKTNQNEFEQEVRNLVDIFNNKSLMFPDLIQKAIDFLESQRKDVFND